MAAPFAVIEYGDIKTTLDGVIIVENIKLRPNNINDVISIDVLELITPGLPYLLGNPEDAITLGELPEKMGVAVKGIRIDLSGELVKVMTEFETDATGYLPETGLACTFSRAFQTEQYKELGIEELILSIATKIEFNEALETLKFSMQISAPGIEEVDMEVVLEDIENAGAGLIGGGRLFTTN